MNKFRLLVVLFAGLMALSSCRFQKDLTLLSDMKNDSTLANLPVTAPNYILKPDDNLYITIQTPNEEINKLYNVNNSLQGGGAQSYTDPSGQYLYGNLVDKEGKVTLPSWGRFQLPGLPLPKHNRPYNSRPIFTSRKQR